MPRRIGLRGDVPRLVKRAAHLIAVPDATGIEVLSPHIGSAHCVVEVCGLLLDVPIILLIVVEPVAPFAVRICRPVVVVAIDVWIVRCVRVINSDVAVQMVIGVSGRQVARVGLARQIPVGIICVSHRPLRIARHRIGQRQTTIRGLLWVLSTDQAQERVVHEEALLCALRDLPQVA